MSRLRFNISMSLDGYVAGPNQTVTHPLGEGGEQLHEWAFAVRSVREMHNMEGGTTGTVTRTPEPGRRSQARP